MTFLNPAAEKLFGFTRREMLGQALHEAIHQTRPDGRPYPASECPVMRCILSGASATALEPLLERVRPTSPS